MPLVCKKRPNTVLSPSEGDRLAKWLIDMSKVGYGRSRQELIETVRKIMKADGRPNPFPDDRSGKDWFYGFMNRYPQSRYNPSKD